MWSRRCRRMLPTGHSTEAFCRRAVSRRQALRIRQTVSSAVTCAVTAKCAAPRRSCFGTANTLQDPEPGPRLFALRPANQRQQLTNSRRWQKFVTRSAQLFARNWLGSRRDCSAGYSSEPLPAAGYSREDPVGESIFASPWRQDLIGRSRWTQPGRLSSDWN